MIEGSIDTSVIRECFNQLSIQIDKRSYVLLDNAPMPRSKVGRLNQSLTVDRLLDSSC
jgi:hypothetical protein